jgi:hypothetical protein
MDSNDAAKVVGQSAGSHREGLFMVWKYGASGDEPRVTPNGHVLTASEAILLSMYGHVTNVLARQLGGEGTEEINLSHEMTSWSMDAGRLQQLWFGDSE